MSTPRKRWFRLADSVLREGWRDAVLADVVRLMAFLNGRWARDGLTAEQAGTVILTGPEQMLITNTTDTRRARKRLLELPEKSGITSIVVESCAPKPWQRRDSHAAGTRQRRSRHVFGVQITWPKFSEFQDFPSPSVPLPHPLPELGTRLNREKWFEKDPNYCWPNEIPPIAKPEFTRVAALAREKGFHGDVRPILERAIRRIGSTAGRRNWQEVVDGLGLEELCEELDRQFKRRGGR